MATRWVSKRVLITVKTYPTPAWKGGEVVCTAGVTAEGEWIRLFPIPFRLLTGDRQFKKYQWVEVSASKPSHDLRPESYQLDVDSISVVSPVLPTTSNWKERKGILFPLRAHCLCCLKAQRDATGAPTLGLFRPKDIRRLVIERTSPQWSAEELARLRQARLFEEGPSQELEKIPYTFSYEFACDEAHCHGHTLSCTDWEICQAYRAWSKPRPDDWEGKFRARFEKEMMEKNDTHFFVGTIHGHPATWIIVGLFYPRRAAASS